MRKEKRRFGAVLKIFLKTTQPAKEGDVWVFNAIATVFRGRSPLPDVLVQFYLDGLAIHDPVPTEGDGRATKQLFKESPGPYQVEARIADDRYPGNYIHTLRGYIAPQKPKTPATIKIIKEGQQGRYRFLIQVLDESNKGVKAQIKVVDSVKETEEKIETDDKGVAEFSVSFLEEERFLTFLVLGTGLGERYRLFGPWPKNKR